MLGRSGDDRPGRWRAGLRRGWFGSKSVREGESTAACQDDEQQAGANSSLSSHGALSPCDVVQQTPGKPGVVGIPPVDVAFDGHVELPGRMLEGGGVGVGMAGTPLIPAFPI